MGRARSGQQAAVVGGFNTLLGARRGSVVAQAERDDAESAARQAAVNAALGDLVAIASGPDGFGSPILPHDDGLVFCIGLLADAYRQQWPAAQVAASLLAKIDGTPQFKLLTLFSSLAAYLRRGDPDACPGLTTPIQLALCDYFQERHDDDPVSADYYGELVIKRLLGSSPKLDDYYQRLEPLFAALAGPISEPRAQALGLQAARKLGDVPETALAGPLRSWINAFVARFDTGCSYPDHEQELRKTLAKYAPDSEGGRALAALAARLEN